MFLLEKLPFAYINSTACVMSVNILIVLSLAALIDSQSNDFVS
jgi:hypothetical protein